MKVAVLVFACALVGAPQMFAQAPPACRVLCTPEFKVEPTVSFTNAFGSPRIVDEQGTTTRAPRETAFEVILYLGLPTRVAYTHRLNFELDATAIADNPDRQSLGRAVPISGVRC